MAQTRRQIQAILESAGLSPLKRFGQNFLIDGNLMRKLVAAAELRQSDVVLEVGPGTGALTELLIESAAHVVAVEIDRGLQGICRERFAHHANFTLIGGDILARKSEIAPAVLEALESRQAATGGRIVLVANLPYQVAMPVLIDLIMDDLPVSPLCFTVQAEVGDRIAASPGGKEYGPVSILAQLAGHVGRIVRVPPEAFWPAPKVHSVMMKWERLSAEPSSMKQREALSRLVHHCFNYRRKTLRSSLKTLLSGSVLNTLVAGAWDLNLRPEQLTPEQWHTLSREIAINGA